MENVLLLNNKEFLEYLYNSEIDINDEVVNKIINFENHLLILLSSKLDKEKLLKILNFSELISYDKFQKLYLPSKDRITTEVIKNKKYFEFITRIDSSNFRESIFVNLSIPLKKFILDQREELDKIDLNLYLRLLQSLREKEFNQIANSIKDKKLFLSQQQLEQYINSKNLNLNISDNNINSVYLLKVKTQVQYEMLSKFNIFLNVKEEDEYIVFDNDVRIKKEFIEKLKEKHLKSLIEIFSKKNPNGENNTELFLATLYCYSIFGYSNALNIINDKYTDINDSTLKKAAESDYIDCRRQYRVENQSKFFSCALLNKVCKNFKNQNYEYILSLSKNLDKIKYTEMLDELYASININDDIQLNKKLEEIIKEIIEEREEIYKDQKVNEYVKNYKKTSTEKRGKLFPSELYILFENIDLKEIEIASNGEPILNDKLQTFLLGNKKRNNDCLLRLILNQLAMGLNDTIDEVINNFKMIEEITKNSKGILSTNSMLDVIDMSKTFLYKLKPDEQDITLGEIAKILKNRNHCNEASEDLIFKTKELHKERKRKVSSTIPTVSGTIDNTRFEVMKFDDPSLLTIGIDTGNCFKIGGKGEDFFRYCLLNKNAVIVGITDRNGKFYMCPIVRNGNGIYGNGIDPKPETDELKKDVLRALTECSKKIIKDSNYNEKIEFAAVMDLHQEDFFKEQGLKKINIEDNLAIEDSFYADYYKKDNSCYVIESINKDEIIQNSYNAKMEFKQKRFSNYEYKINDNYDKERIELIINSIYFANFDSIISKQIEIDSMKRKFKRICLEDYEFVIGNKDWFILIGKDMNIISYRLDYDSRAVDEYFKALNYIKKIYLSNCMEESRKNGK